MDGVALLRLALAYQAAADGATSPLAARGDLSDNTRRQGIGVAGIRRSYSSAEHWLFGLVPGGGGP
jgi:hypothetical protein